MTYKIIHMKIIIIINKIDVEQSHRIEDDTQMIHYWFDLISFDSNFFFPPKWTQFIRLPFEPLNHRLQ